MSAAEAVRFMSSLEAEEALVERLAALREDPAAVHALVRAAGFDCTPEEIKQAFLQVHGAELSAEQLDAIAGGMDDWMLVGGVAAVGAVSFAVVGITGSAAAAAV